MTFYSPPVTVIRVIVPVPLPFLSSSISSFSKITETTADIGVIYSGLKEITSIVKNNFYRCNIF